MSPERAEPPRPVLANMKALITGIANEHSIAYGCAKAFREFGATCSSTRRPRAPLGELVDIMDVGYTCAFLATPYARRVSGGSTSNTTGDASSRGPRKPSTLNSLSCSADTAPDFKSISREHLSALARPANHSRD